MESSIFEKAAKFLREKKNNKRWLTIFICMAVIVAAGTIAVLTMPGQALNHTKRVLDCKYEVHEHTDECYTVDENGERVLTCGLADYVVHTHNDDCYDADGNLVCTLPEIEKHEHTDECYTEEKVLTCGLEESAGHVHDASCYTDERGDLICGLEEHQHTDDCYDAAGNIICGLEEHTHGDDCYTVNHVLTCQIPEGQGAHTHTDECYTTEKVLTCGKLELHTHDDDCYETDEDGNKHLICTKTVLEEHVHNEDCIKTVELTDEEVAALNDKETVESDGEGASDENESADTTDENAESTDASDESAESTDASDESAESTDASDESAESTDAFDESADEGGETTEPTYICGKEEHTHSEECYDENGELICGKEEHTHSEECVAPEEETSEAATVPVELICGKEEHTHSEECYDENGELICGKEEHTHDKSCLKINYLCGKEEHIHDASCRDEIGSELICGKEEHIHDLSCLTTEGTDLTFYCGKEEHTHDETCYDENGNLICGKEEHTHDFFCLLNNEEETEEPTEDTVLTAEGEDYIITVTIPADAIPELQGELSLSVREIDPESEEYRTAISVMEEQGIGDASNRLFDIALLDGGNEIEPLAPVTVSYASVDPMTGDAPAGDALEMEEPSIGDPSMEGPSIEEPAAGEGAEDPADDERAPQHIDKVYHIDVESNSVEDMNATVEDDGKVTMITPHFSYYAFIDTATLGSIPLDKDIWTVDQDYTITGETKLNKNLTIDLNGHTLTAKKDPMINTNGYKLVITDNSETAINIKPVETVYGGSNNGNVAKYDKKLKKLTYYVTKPVILGDGTIDTCYQNEVDLTSMGAIESSAKTLIEVTGGGSLELKNGRLTSEGCSSIKITGIDNLKTVTISGGYICGSGSSEKDKNGGAIQLPYESGNCTLNINGGVIAANKAWNGGAIYFDAWYNDCDVFMNGGYISGNEASGKGDISYDDTSESARLGYGGGGIYLLNCDFTLSGGYITNNYSTGCEHYDGNLGNASQDQLDTGSASQGGGGVYFLGSPYYNRTFQMNDGYISGNYAANAAGGIYMRFGGADEASFTMNGGYVSSNVAGFREGGGIFIDQYIHGTINSGYITNNETRTVRDWGGGGIFVSGNGGDLTVYNALVTDNEAWGFGGGVAGCPTGQLYLQESDGCGVFENKAHGDGGHLSQSGKTQDHLAWNNKVFMENGYQDFYSALAARVYNHMLGGGLANWSGSVDSMPLTDAQKNAVYFDGESITGLTANPSPEDMQKARNSARVYISGNKSNTHGGGIMCNGIISFGFRKTRDYYRPVTFEITKSFNVGGKSAQLTDGQFEFTLERVNDENSTKGELVATGYNDATGAIGGIEAVTPKGLQNTNLVYYILKEVVPDGAIATEYDPSWYKIRFTVSSKTNANNDKVWYFTGNTNECKSGWAAIHVWYSNNQGKNWTKLTRDTHYKFSYSTSGHGKLTIYGPNGEGDTTFENNFSEEPMYLHLIKYAQNEDSNEKTILRDVKFTLEDITNSLPNGEKKDETQEASSDYEGLVSFKLSKKHTYLLKEEKCEANEKYNLEGPWIVIPNESDGGETVNVYKAKEENGQWVKDGDALQAVKHPFTSGHTGYGDTTKVELATYEVVNTPVQEYYELPESGGIGTVPYTVGAVLLFAAAALVYTIKFKGRGRKSSGN